MDTFAPGLQREALELLQDSTLALKGSSNYAKRLTFVRHELVFSP